MFLLLQKSFHSVHLSHVKSFASEIAIKPNFYQIKKLELISFSVGDKPLLHNVAIEVWK